MQSELAPSVVRGPPASRRTEVDLLVDVSPLRGSRSSGSTDRVSIESEPVQFERLPDDVDEVLLDDPPFRQELRESRKRSRIDSQTAPVSRQSRSRALQIGVGRPFLGDASSAVRGRAARPPSPAVPRPWSAGSPACPRGCRRASRFCRSIRRTAHRRRRRARRRRRRRGYGSGTGRTPSVCPGAWSTRRSMPASEIRTPSVSSWTSSGSVIFSGSPNWASSRRVSSLIAFSGSTRSSRSRLWIQALDA